MNTRKLKIIVILQVFILGLVSNKLYSQLSADNFSSFSVSVDSTPIDVESISTCYSGNCAPVRLLGINAAATAERNDGHPTIVDHLVVGEVNDTSLHVFWMDTDLNKNITKVNLDDATSEDIPVPEIINASDDNHFIQVPLGFEYIDDLGLYVIGPIKRNSDNDANKAWYTFFDKLGGSSEDGYSTFGASSSLNF